MAFNDKVEKTQMAWTCHPTPRNSTNGKNDHVWKNSQQEEREHLGGHG